MPGEVGIQDAGHCDFDVQARRRLFLPRRSLYHYHHAAVHCRWLAGTFVAAMGSAMRTHETYTSLVDRER